MERAMEKRLKQIAVNEVGNIFSQLTKTYQKEANIDFYMWQTMRDEKVRSSHRKREGAFYFWEKQEAIEVEGVTVNPCSRLPPWLPVLGSTHNPVRTQKSAYFKSKSFNKNSAGC